MEQKYFFYDNQIELEKVEEQIERKILARGGKMMISKVYFQEGAVAPRHQHFHEQVTYCLKGKVEFYIGDQTAIIEPGDSVYIPPHCLHGCKVLEGDAILLDIFTPQREDFLSN